MIRMKLISIFSFLSTLVSKEFMMCLLFFRFCLVPYISFISKLSINIPNCLTQRRHCPLLHVCCLLASLLYNYSFDPPKPLPGKNQNYYFRNEPEEQKSLNRFPLLLNLKSTKVWPYYYEPWWGRKYNSFPLVQILELIEAGEHQQISYILLFLSVSSSTSVKQISVLTSLPIHSNQQYLIIVNHYD